MRIVFLKHNLLVWVGTERDIRFIQTGEKLHTGPTFLLIEEFWKSNVCRFLVHCPEHVLFRKATNEF